MPTAKTKHTVTIDGHTFTRTSDHPYTHVVIVPSAQTFEAALAKAEAAHGYGESWDRQAALASSDTPDEAPGGTLDERIAATTARNARDFIRQNPDRAAYVAGARARDVANVRKAHAKGLFQWQPVSWHRSEALARKAIRPYHAGARVVAVGSDVKTA